MLRIIFKNQSNKLQLNHVIDESLLQKEKKKIHKNYSSGTKIPKLAVNFYAKRYFFLASHLTIPQSPAF